MEFAICNETFGDWSFDKAFATVAECGYTGIEIAPFTLADDAREISAAQRTGTRHLAEKHGLEVVGLHWLLTKTEGFYLTSPDAATRLRTSDYLAALARLCRDLGGSILVLGSPQQRNLLPGISHDEAMGYAADLLRTCMPEFEACGVTLAVEPLAPAEGDFLLTAEKGIELATMVDSPHCRLHLDVKAMSSESKPIDQIIRDSRESIVHFHANDANLRGPGMGDIDFRPIFAALEEIQYTGWVCVEVFDYTPGAEHIARESMRYMQEVLAG